MKIDYTKAKKGNEFFKVIDEAEAISIMITEKNSRVLVTTNEMSILDYLDEEYVHPSNELEFMHAWNEATKRTLDTLLKKH